MIRKSALLGILNYCKYSGMLHKLLVINNFPQTHFHTSTGHRKDPVSDIVIYENFESIENKSKKTYLEMIKIFETRGTHRTGHVEFIYSALKNMKEFNVEKDLEVYKALIDVLPKGKFIPTNMFQAEFMHYPKQQQCAIDLLEQMEDNAVLPDKEVETMLLNIFGKRGYPLRKLWRIMYWMPKFKNLSPWPVPQPLPNDTLELAKLAVARIGSVDIQTQISVFQSKDIPEALEDTWIVSAQSPTQCRLLSEHDVSQPIYVEGRFRIWMKNVPITYFILRGDAKIAPRSVVDLDDVSNISVPFFSYGIPPKQDIVPVPSVHEQEDGVIFAVCVTGTSGRDSLLSWIRHLEKNGNPNLASIPVVFTLKSPEKDLANIETAVATEK
uniref:Evolutionarily conserved signaling intermediate in Toll pathway, mitochondrial n=1 Tax=Photinus pyralis TaxID=7054 RepID=A0A1Y1MVW3_PHOPY